MNQNEEIKGSMQPPTAHIQHLANPDDPPVHRPPIGLGGPWPAPNYLGLPGRTAIVQGQVFIVAFWPRRRIEES